MLILSYKRAQLVFVVSIQSPRPFLYSEVRPYGSPMLSEAIHLPLQNSQTLHRLSWNLRPVALPLRSLCFYFPSSTPKTIVILHSALPRFQISTRFPVKFPRLSKHSANLVEWRWVKREAYFWFSIYVIHSDNSSPWYLASASSTSFIVTPQSSAAFLVRTLSLRLRSLV